MKIYILVSSFALECVCINTRSVWRVWWCVGLCFSLKCLVPRLEAGIVTCIPWSALVWLCRSVCIRGTGDHRLPHTISPPSTPTNPHQSTPTTPPQTNYFFLEFLTPILNSKLLLIHVSASPTTHCRSLSHIHSLKFVVLPFFNRCFFVTRHIPT